MAILKHSRGKKENFVLIRQERQYLSWDYFPELCCDLDSGVFYKLGLLMNYLEGLFIRGYKSIKQNKNWKYVHIYVVLKFREAGTFQLAEVWR